MQISNINSQDPHYPVPVCNCEKCRTAPNGSGDFYHFENSESFLGNDTEKLTTPNKKGSEKEIESQTNILAYKNLLKTTLGKSENEDLERELKTSEENLNRKLAYARSAHFKEIIRATSDHKKRQQLNSILLCGTGKTTLAEPSINVAYNNGKASYHNVKTCKSRNCPICAYKRARAQRDEIFLALYRAFKRGYNGYFLTLTASHSAMDDFKELSDKFKKAENKFRKRKLFAEFNKNALGRISSWESTYGVENGYHPHFHGFILTKDDMDFDEVVAFEKALFKDWADCLRSVGLSANSAHGLKLRKIGYSNKNKRLNGDDLIDDLNTMSEYTTTTELKNNKFNYEGLKGASNELSFEKNKIGRGGNFTFFELLDYYIELKKLDDPNAQIYMRNIENILRDWAIGNKGNRAVNFSTNLKRALGIPQSKNARMEIIEQLKEEDLFFKLYKKPDDGVTIDKANKREMGFKLGLRTEDLHLFDYLRVRHEMLQLVENGNVSEKDLNKVLEDLRNMQMQRQRTTNRTVVRALRDVASLYLRRCTAESRAINYDDFISNILQLYPYLNGYIRQKRVFKLWEQRGSRTVDSPLLNTLWT